MNKTHGYQWGTHGEVGRDPAKERSRDEVDRHLLTFITVAERRNFTRAAEELHLSQSAVSKSIAALEREYGTELLYRTNKLVRLTRAGEILYFHGKGIVSDYTRVATLISDLTTSATGNLVIGSSYTFGEYILPHIIAGFKQLYPRISPKITIMNSTRISHRVANGQVDLGIIDSLPETREVVTQPFAQDDMLVIVPTGHTLAGRDTVEIHELADETWIVREPGSGTRTVTDRAFQDMNFAPTSMMEFGSTQIIKESVRAGLGVSIVSKFVIEGDVKFGLVRALQIKNYRVTRDFYCVTQASKFRPKALTLFLDFLYKWPHASSDSTASPSP